MPTYKQIRFPELGSTDGNYRLIVNREGEVDLALPAADTFTFDEPLKIVASLGDLSQDQTDDEGYPVAPIISVSLMDRKDYSGLCNGSAVSGSGYNSLFHEWLFTDKTIRYAAFLLLDDEVIFSGEIDPLSIRADHSMLHNVYSSSEENKQVLSFEIISGAEKLATKTMDAVKAAVVTSDCVNGDFYHGFTWAKGWKSVASPEKKWNPFTTGNERTSGFMDRQYFWIHAAPFWQNTAADLNKDCFFSGFGSNYWTLFHGGATPDIALGGLWGIKISKIVELIADECNMDFTSASDIASSLDFYRQKVNNTTSLWEPHTTPYAAVDLYINYNVWFGVHPLDGSDWVTPVSFKDKDTCGSALQKIADFLLSDLRLEPDSSTGKLRIKFYPKDYDHGEIPVAWQETIMSSKEGAPFQGVSYVKVKNQKDDLTIKCPAGAVGESAERVIAFRYHKVGPDEEIQPGFDQYGYSPNITNIIYDGKFPNEEQYKCFFAGKYVSTSGGNQPKPETDLWRGLLCAYIHHNSSSNIFYPSNWKAMDGSNNWEGFYCISFALKSGGSIPSAPIPESYYNSRDLHAQVFAKDLVGIRKTLERDHIGVLADDGTFGGLKLNQTVQFLYNGVPDTVFEIFNLKRNLKQRTSDVVYRERLTFPTITELSTDEDGDQSTTTSSSSTTTIQFDNSTTWNDTFRVTTRKVVLYSGGVAMKTYNKVMLFETFDSSNNRWVVQYGFMPQTDTPSGSNYGYNDFLMFHYKGTADKGNVWIEGLSPDNPSIVPDYWVAAITQFKRGTAETNLYYDTDMKIWSEDRGDWLVKRGLEKANVNRRIYVAGRFKCERSGGLFTNLTWISLSSNPYPMSDNECKSDTELGMLAAAATPPTLVGNANSVDIIWSTRLKPVSIMAQAWGHNIVINAWDWQIGANPVSNQICASNPAQNARSVNIHLWLNDFNGGVGARHILQAGALDLDGQPGLDVYFFDFWGTLEVVGDDATTI